MNDYPREDFDFSLIDRIALEELWTLKESDTMPHLPKWIHTAVDNLPLIEALLIQVNPATAKLIPHINDAIHAAQAIHGDTNNDAKKALITAAAQLATDTGKVAIQPSTAVAITDAVLNILDGIHAAVKLNQPATQNLVQPTNPAGLSSPSDAEHRPV